MLCAEVHCHVKSSAINAFMCLHENLMKTTDRHLFACAQIVVEHWPAEVNGRDFAAVLVRCSLVGSVVVLF